MRLNPSSDRPNRTGSARSERAPDRVGRPRSKPGNSPRAGVDPIDRLLGEALKIAPSDVVLNLNAGTGFVGAVAASKASAGRVILTTAQLDELNTARQTLAENGVTNASVWFSSGISRLDPIPVVDVVVARLPKGRLPIRQCIWDTFVALRPGGQFYLGGANDDGIQSALARVAELFGDVDVPLYGKGARVGVVTKPLTAMPVPDEFSDPLLDHHTFHRYDADLGERRLTIASRPGVFSWDEVDVGTRALLAALSVKPGDLVLDLGCGAGIIGVFVAEMVKPGRVYLVDVNADAVDSASQTVAANNATNCVVLASDSTAAVQNQRFDVVLTNPPFHVARRTDLDVTYRFIADVRSVLKPNGSFYLVANQFLPYEDAMRRTFGNVETVSSDRRYKVLRAIAGAR